ncbi:hypothetical protein BGX23_005476, partial [Mortierella sp. AD031]
DCEYEDPEEEDIKMRLMETEHPSPVSTHSRPAMINTSSSPAGSPNYPRATTGTPAGALSPIRSPTQAAYNAPSSHYQQSQHSPVSSSPRGFVAPPQQQQSPQSDNFFDDVLAAVDSKSSQQSPKTYMKPPAPASPSSQQQQQQYIQQQQLKPVHVEQAVFGAPSPRIAPAGVSGSSHNGHPSSPARSGARPPPSPGHHQQYHHQQQQQQQQKQGHGADDEEKAFYESSLL